MPWWDQGGIRHRGHRVATGAAYVPSSVHTLAPPVSPVAEGCVTSGHSSEDTPLCSGALEVKLASLIVPKCPIHAQAG